ncbi:hypothetical protein [Janibacter sp. GXQ6167]|uniref:hypothetical protein n=1 Tax=Janibacter sp. GXQ6167 TaxID=3240791 RepID=UPI0035241F0D
MSVLQAGPADELTHNQRRPVQVWVGVAIVVLRALAVGSAMLLTVVAPEEMELAAEDTHFAIIVLSIVAVIQVLFAIGLFCGSNLARMLVMGIATISIITAAWAYFGDGQQIRTSTTLVAVTLDVFILLALSSDAVRRWILDPRR